MVMVMRRRWQIALIALIALALYSVGFCGIACSGCEASLYPTHEHGGSCHQHSRNSNHQTSHKCCHSAFCLSAAELTTDNDCKAAGAEQMILPIVLTLRLIEPTESVSSLAALARVHAPPSSLPIFLSIRTLLI